jgi:predicted RNase H-like HicB family nuclease
MRGEQVEPRCGVCGRQPPREGVQVRSQWYCNEGNDRQRTCYAAFTRYTDWLRDMQRMALEVQSRAPLQETTSYRVMVTREEEGWVADVPEVPGAHTQAESFTDLERHVREAIVLMTDRDDGDTRSFRLAWSFPERDTPLDGGG